MKGFNDHSTENDKPVDLSMLRHHGRGERVYSEGRGVLVRVCHDVMINKGDGILLVTRDFEPAKGYLWPIGGGINRGIPTEESLRQLTKRECGLGLKEVEFLYASRLMWQTSPFRNGKGTDDLGLMFFARGEGDIKLDKLHKEPRIITPHEWVDLRKKLHPYVRKGMYQSMRRIVPVDASAELCNILIEEGKELELI